LAKPEDQTIEIFKAKAAENPLRERKRSHRNDGGKELKWQEPNRTVKQMKIG
jgi:hypothetical protein